MSSNGVQTKNVIEDTEYDFCWIRETPRNGMVSLLCSLWSRLPNYGKYCQIVPWRICATL